MGDNKKWFKVWTCLLTDPEFDDIDNLCIGAWVRLGALVAIHGIDGKLTLSQQQFIKRANLSNDFNDMNNLIQCLSKINVRVQFHETQLVSLSFDNWGKYQTDWNSYERLKKYRNSQNETKQETVQDKKRSRREENKKRYIFIPPTLEEIKVYCLERKNNIDPEKWLSFYEAKGWMIGKNKMKDWKAAVRTWEGNEQSAVKQVAIRCTYDKTKPCFGDCQGCNSNDKHKVRGNASL